MLAHQQGLLHIDSTLASIDSTYTHTNKAHLTPKAILSHHARLPAWIPFYVETLDSITGKPLPTYYSKKKSEKFSIRIRDDLYLRTDYRDTIYARIDRTPLVEREEYLYSDLGYYILARILERKWGKPLETLADSLLYRPMRTSTMGYKPLQKFESNRIVPSQSIDKPFRKTMSSGYVNDEGATMLGGVSGHAGMFANSADLAKFMNMYLHQGRHMNKQLIKAKTIELFNQTYFSDKENRRGVGFDKPQLDPTRDGSTSGCVSYDGFGHFGFTGTYTWADPSKGMVMVFLSNRTYPDRSHRLLGRENIRTEVQRWLYLSIDDRLPY